MPGQKRYRIPDIPQHVIARGNDRKACFFDPSDYRGYLDVLYEAAARYRNKFKGSDPLNPDCAGA